VAKRLGNQVALQELPHYETHALMHDQLGNDQRRQRNEKPAMHFDVQQEGYGDAGPPNASPSASENTSNGSQ
jgi:hypothetical protein